MMSKCSSFVCFAIACLMTMPANALMMGRRDIPDKVVETPVGTVTLTHLRYILQGGVYTLLGDAVNGASRPWVDLSISVTLADKNGPVTMKTGWGQPLLPKLFLHIHNLQPGAKQEFKFAAFVSADQDSVAATTTFADGEFPVVYRVGLLKPTASDSLLFETDGYAVAFSIQDQGLHFTLRNKGDGVVRIDWNSVAYVDPSGQSQGVIHRGIKLADRTAPKAPTIVPPGASIDDEIIPVNNIEFVNSEWVTHSMLPSGTDALPLVGRTLTVFLPLDVDGKVENRSFVFKILEVK